MDPIRKAAAGIAQHMEQATAATKCHACGCFQDAVGAFEQSDLAQWMKPTLAAARSAFTEREYDCLGCGICWPADALNAGSEVVPLPAEACCSSAASDPREGWPPYPGSYEVVRYTAPVAVCTLHSRDLVQAIRQAAPEGLSIVGSLQTENLGIERLVENVVSNPNIRFLLLCGEDTSDRVGHCPGQSLMAFTANGVDEQGRIEGADGKRPVLKNVDSGFLQHFRQHVMVIDAIGLQDVSEIVGRITLCAVGNPGPAPSPGPAVRDVPVHAAAESGPLVLDPAGYLVITPDHRRQVIVVEHFDNEGVLRAMVEGTRADDLAATVIGRGLVTRMDHAAYLGRQLTLAESALEDGQSFFQDAAPE